MVVRDLDGQPNDVIITKGAFANVLDICSHVVDHGNNLELDKQRIATLSALFESWSADGYRVLALATRRIQQKSSYQRDDDGQRIECPRAASPPRRVKLSVPFERPLLVDTLGMKAEC